MANYKRRKSRRQVRCTLCTDGREGNANKGTGKRARVALERRTKSQRKKEAERQVALEDLFRAED